LLTLGAGFSLAISPVKSVLEFCTLGLQFDINLQCHNAKYLGTFGTILDNAPLIIANFSLK